MTDCDGQVVGLPLFVGIVYCNLNIDHSVSEESRSPAGLLRHQKGPGPKYEIGCI